MFVMDINFFKLYTNNNIKDQRKYGSYLDKAILDNWAQFYHEDKLRIEQETKIAKEKADERIKKEIEKTRKEKEERDRIIALQKEEDEIAAAIKKLPMSEQKAIEEDAKNNIITKISNINKNIL